MKLCTLPLNPVGLSVSSFWGNVTHRGCVTGAVNKMAKTWLILQKVKLCPVILLTLCIKVMQSSAAAVRYRKVSGSSLFICLFPCWTCSSSLLLQVPRSMITFQRDPRPGSSLRPEADPAGSGNLWPMIREGETYTQPWRVFFSFWKLRVCVRVKKQKKKGWCCFLLF